MLGLVWLCCAAPLQLPPCAPKYTHECQPSTLLICQLAWPRLNLTPTPSAAPRPPHPHPLQVGTLRFDINTISETLSKSARKDAQAAKKEFFAVVEDLDFAMRKKDQDKALKALEKAKSKLDATLAKLG